VRAANLLDREGAKVMIQVSILYLNTPDSRFDIDYYLNQHMPMTIRLLSPALRGVTVDQGISGATPDQTPTYAAGCHLRFDSADAFYSAFVPHAEKLQADIPNYTDVAPVIQISEIRISR